MKKSCIVRDKFLVQIALYHVLYCMGIQKKVRLWNQKK